MSLANGNFGGGNGEQNNPFLVEDAYDLIALQNSKIPSRPNEEPYYVKVVNDIDMSGHTWDELLYISLHFEGNNNTISNLVLEEREFFNYYTHTCKNIKFDNLIKKSYYGLFVGGHSDTTNVIENLTANWVTIPYYSDHPSRPEWSSWNVDFSLLAGYLGNYQLSNVHGNVTVLSDGIDGTVDTYYRGGALAGQIRDSYLDNCSFNVHIEYSPYGTPSCEGFAAGIQNCVLNNCHVYNTGYFHGYGFAFDIGSESVLSHCSSNSVVESQSDTLGRNVEVRGFSWYVNRGATLSFCSASTVGEVNGFGFANDISDATVQDCYAVLNEAIGAGKGFSERIEHATVTRCYSNGKLTYDEDQSTYNPYTAGFSHEIRTGSVVENCIAIIESITAITVAPPDWYKRFSFNTEIANTNYVLAEMQFIDKRDFSSWGGSSDPIPFDDGIPIPDTTLKTQAFYESLGFEFGKGKWIIDEGESYPRHDYSEAIPVYKCKTFYLN